MGVYVDLNAKEEWTKLTGFLQLAEERGEVKLPPFVRNYMYAVDKEYARIARNAPPIKVWKFDDAPPEYQFSQGGDEDWVAFVPDYYRYDYIPWLDVPHFAVCEVKIYDVEGGQVYVGRHA